MVSITEQRNINLTQATVLPRNILPVPEGVLGIDRNENNIAVAVLKLLETVLESEHFGRANKGECRRYEEYYKPRLLVFIDVGAERDFCDLVKWIS